jgi:hypothetical protein
LFLCVPPASLPTARPSTGIYSQYEAHLRIYGKELRKSMQFLSRQESNDPTGPWPSTVLLEIRWFATAPIADRV